MKLHDGKLTRKQRAFVQEWIATGNTTQSMIKAGYSKDGASQQGSRMLRLPKIKAEIEKILGPEDERIKQTRERLINHLSRAVFTPMTNFTEWSGGATSLRDSNKISEGDLCLIESIEENVNAVGHNLKIKLLNRTKCAELLCRILGMFIHEETDKEVFQPVVVVLDNGKKIVYADPKQLPKECE